MTGAVIEFILAAYKLETGTMISRQTTIQFKQLATRLSSCNVATLHSWTPSMDINLFGRGYEPEQRVLEVTS